MKRAVILCRMSQAVNDLGNERQEAACREHCKLRGIEVVAVFRDVISATKYRLNSRPGWRNAVAAVKAGKADGICVYHVDRLTRDNRDLEEVIDTGIPVTAAAGEIDLATDSGRTIARILTAIARGEVERKGARQKLANRQRAATGKPWSGGARPFGYTDDQMEVVEEEADAIRWAAVAALDGVSMKEIAREWGRRGLESSRAKHAKAAWTSRGVKAVLVSPRYAGIRIYRGVEVGQGAWPAILDMDTHIALKTKLTDPARKLGVNSGGKAVRNLVTNIGRCGDCDAPVRASALSGRPTYTCPTGHVNPDREKVDIEVAGAMIGLLSQPAFLATLMPTGDDELDDARTDLDALRRRAKILAEGYAQGTVDEETFVGVSKTLRERIEAGERDLTAMTQGYGLDGLSIGTEQVADEWLGLTLERQRILVDRFLDVRLLRKERRADQWDADVHLYVKRKKAPTPVAG